MKRYLPLLLLLALPLSAQTYPTRASALNYGTTGGTAAQGNDSRIVGALPTGVTGAAADGTTNDSAALAAVCTAGKEVVLTPGASYLIGTTTVLPCALDFIGGAKLIAATGITLTLNGPIHAPSVPIIQVQGTGNVVFGLSTTEVPVEWFGAVGDAAFGVAGTDNTVPMQNAINAISSGHIVLGSHFYRTTAALVINKGNVGIRGTDAGYSGITGAYAPVSVILNSTAGSDIVDVVGTSTNYAAWGDFRNFSVMRSVTPSGTAAGLSFNYAGGYSVSNVQSQDSIRDFYFHSAPNFGVGSVQNANAGWGGSGIGGYAGLSTYGWYLDSADGVAENSIVLNTIGASCNASAGCGTNYGMYIYGTAINDVDVDFFNNAGSTYGIYISDPGGTTTAQLPAYDLHFHNITVDGWATSGVYISGVTAALMGGITFTDGYIESLNAGTGHAVDIEGSSGVLLSNIEVDNRNGDGIYANNSANLAIQGNLLSQTHTNFITLSGTTNSTIQGNVLRGDATYPTATMISLIASPTNTITGNTLAGYATTGITFDATSASIQGGNTIDLAHITTAISDPSKVGYFAVQRIGTGIVPAEQMDSSAAVKARGSVENIAGDANSAVMDQMGSNQSRMLSVGPDATHTGGWTLAGISGASANYQAYIACIYNTSCTFATPVVSPSIVGPATAPTGACTPTGAWAFSQDGHATYCLAGTWATKI